jgi:energy-coupling factor transport system ATP-binding protein
MRLQVDAVTFRYSPEVTALRGVSLTVEAGETIAILGENGAGKTTLAKHLNGILTPDEGSVLVGDWDTRGRTTAELARFVSYVYQNPNDQLFERTVAAEVAFGPRNLALSEGEVERRVSENLARVGLEAECETHPYDLHPSQRKLVALAASLAMSAPVLVVDEPTTGQDHRGLEQLGELLDELAAEGKTLIAISHDVDFCAEHFERGLLMSHGRILADGPIAETLAQGELLDRAAVQKPQLMRLADALGLDSKPLDVESFLEAYRGRS